MISIDVHANKLRVRAHIKRWTNMDADTLDNSQLTLISHVHMLSVS